MHARARDVPKAMDATHASFNKIVAYYGGGVHRINYCTYIHNHMHIHSPRHLALAFSGSLLVSGEPKGDSCSVSDGVGVDDSAG
jgi:hypothetical protein